MARAICMGSVWAAFEHSPDSNNTRKPILSLHHVTHQLGERNIELDLREPELGERPDKCLRRGKRLVTNVVKARVALDVPALTGPCFGTCESGRSRLGSTGGTFVGSRLDGTAYHPRGKHSRSSEFVGHYCSSQLL